MVQPGVGRGGHQGLRKAGGHSGDLPQELLKAVCVLSLQAGPLQQQEAQGKGRQETCEIFQSG